MITNQPPVLPGVTVSATAHGGLSITADGQRCELAIATPQGLLVVQGDDVLQLIESVVLANFRNLLRGQGHLTVKS